MSRGHIAATHNRSIYADPWNCTICATNHARTRAQVRQAKIDAYTELRRRQALTRDQARTARRTALHEKEKHLSVRVRQLRCLGRISGLALMGLVAAAPWGCLTTTDIPWLGTTIGGAIGLLLGALLGAVNERDHYRGAPEPRPVARDVL